MQIVKQIDSESKRFWRKAYPNHLVITLDPVRIQCNEFQLEIRDNKMYYYTPEDREDSEIGTITASDIAEGGTYNFSKNQDDHAEPCHSNCKCYELHITALVLHISWDMVQVWEEWDEDIPDFDTVHREALKARNYRALESQVPLIDPRTLSKHAPHMQLTKVD